MVSGLKNYKVKVAAAAAVVLVIVLMVALYLTRPYAVYADGTRVDKPYVIKAAGEELVLVEDAETAEQVIEDVIDEYSPDGAHINSITIDKKITADNKKLDRNQDNPPIVLTEQEAVDYLIGQNSTEDPMFSVTINAEIGSVEELEAETEYEENAEIYEGEEELKTKGKSGNQLVTNEVTSVNGAVLTTKVSDTAVVKDTVNTVIYKGTKKRPRDTVWADYSGEVMGSGSGSSVVGFAMQFVGNKYVYGGTSLTKGADCSGFVQSVYKRFGISLPRTADVQAHCGKGISYSEAKPGDLICYGYHIGIYVGGGKIVHAYNSRRGICVTNAREPGAILTVRRIIE